MPTAYNRGNLLIYDYTLEAWKYEDGVLLNDDLDRPCVKCGQKPIDGMDACLGRLEGYSSVCCGHGITKPIRVRSSNG